MTQKQIPWGDVSTKLAEHQEQSPGRAQTESSQVAMNFFLLGMTMQRMGQTHNKAGTCA